MKYKAFVIVLIAMFSGCSVSPPKPEWVDGESADYPHDEYLLASGTASNEEEAKSRALANLARIFEVQVDDVSVDRNYINTTKNDEGIEFSKSQTVVRYVDAYTEKQLEGAEIAALWTNQETGQRYALAVIARNIMRKRLLTDIAKVDAFINQQMRISQQSLDPFTSLNKMHQALRGIQSREKFKRDLLIVSLDEMQLQHKWTSELINTLTIKVLAGVKARVQVAHSDLMNLEAALQSAASVAGLTVVASEQAYTVVGLLDVDYLGEKSGWYWYRGALEIKLVNNSNDKVRGQKRWPLKVSAVTQEQAKIRLKSAVLALLGREFKQAMMSFN